MQRKESWEVESLRVFGSLELEDGEKRGYQTWASKQRWDGPMRGWEPVTDRGGKHEWEDRNHVRVHNALTQTEQLVFSYMY